MQNKLPCKQTPGASCLWVLPSFLFLECLSTLKRVITCVFSDWHFGSVNYKLRCKKHNILVFKSIIWHVFVILLFIFWRGLAWEFWINRSFLNSSSILWDCYKVCVWTCVCSCICVSICTCGCVCLCIHVYKSLHTRVCVFMHVCVWVHTQLSSILLQNKEARRLGLGPVLFSSCLLPLVSPGESQGLAKRDTL